MQKGGSKNGARTRAVPINLTLSVTVSRTISITPLPLSVRPLERTVRVMYITVCMCIHVYVRAGESVHGLYLYVEFIHVSVGVDVGRDLGVGVARMCSV